MRLKFIDIIKDSFQSSLYFLEISKKMYFATKFINNLFTIGHFKLSYAHHRLLHIKIGSNGSRNDLRKLQPKSVELAYHSFEKVNESRLLTPIVVLHGLYGSLRNFRNFGRELFKQVKPTRKVYLLDARNHGESPHTRSHRYEDQVGDLLQFFEQHKINRAILLGHNMGGNSAMSLALTHVYTQYE